MRRRISIFRRPHGYLHLQHPKERGQSHRSIQLRQLCGDFGESRLQYRIVWKRTGSVAKSAASHYFVMSVYKRTVYYAYKYGIVKETVIKKTFESRCSSIISYKLWLYFLWRNLVQRMHNYIFCKHKFVNGRQPHNC